MILSFFSFFGSIFSFLYVNKVKKRLRDKENLYNTNNNNTNTNTNNNNNRSNIGRPHPVMLLKSYLECIYLDYNATTPIWPEVSEIMLPFTLTSFGNPSSSHIFAKPCKLALNEAKIHISKLINSPNSNSIVMTSCGSESDNRAIDIGIYNYLKSQNNSNNNDNSNNSNNPLPHIIASSIEHPAIIEYLKYLALTNKIEYTLVNVDNDGFVNPDDVFNLLQDNTALVTIMHSNNEIGTLQPIQEISKKIQIFNENLISRGLTRSPVLFHSDGAQSVGKVWVDVQSLNVDLFTIVGHKYGAPKGIAALYIRDGISLQPLLFGGGQENGRRAGTENILLTVALGEASRIALVEFHDLVIHLLDLRFFLVSLLRETFKDTIRFNGPNKAYDLKYISNILEDTQQNPDLSLLNSVSLGVLLNTVNVSFHNIQISKVIPLLSNFVACSAGAACHSHGTHSVSSVLLAIQVPEEFQLGTLRLSFGRHTTREEIQKGVQHIANAIKNQSLN